MKNNTLSYSPVFPLLVIYPRDTETLTRKDTYTPMFMAALFTTAMIRKQRNHPSADERLKRWYTPTHTMEYHSVIKTMEIYHLQQHAGFGGYYTKWNKLEKDKYCMISLRCKISKL